MTDDLAHVKAVVSDAYQHLQNGSRARPVLGCFPMHVPEELLHAAGFLPVTIFGSDGPETQVDALIQPYICSPVRSSLERALRGEFDFFAGVIFPDICDSVQLVSDMWCDVLKPNFAFNYVLPAKTFGSSAEQYLLWELARLRSALQDFAGRKITDDDLTGSIAIYNRQRSLLRELYEVRRTRPGIIAASAMANVVVASMVMPKDDHIALVERLLRSAVAGGARREGIKVVLSGNLCDEPTSDTLRMIDDLGAVVVDDDLYTGSNYFWADVPTDCDPFVALARRDFNTAPCPTRHDPRKHKDPADHLLRLVDRAHARAVIVLETKYCEPHAIEYPYVKERLEAAGVPHFLIETEHEMKNLGQVRTRLQAFLEMLGD